MKRLIVALMAVLTIGTFANAKLRMVYRTDSVTNERIVIEVNDTMRNGHAETDTLSITRYPINAKYARATYHDYDDDDDLESVARFLDKSGTAIALITLAVIFGIFIGPLLIIALIFYFRHKNRKAKYELAAKMIEKGEPLPADIEETVRGLKDMESRGIRNMCIGAALFIFIWGLTDSFGLGCIGLLVLANGASQYIIARRTKDKEDETEVRQLKEELRRMKERQGRDDIETVDAEEV